MSEQAPIDTNLPDDLETYGVGTNAGPAIFLARDYIRITDPAAALIGRPDLYIVQFGRKSRMLVLRPSSGESGGRKTTVSGRTRTVLIQCNGLSNNLRLPQLPKSETHRFTPAVVDGCLLIGPLPEIKP